MEQRRTHRSREVQGRERREAERRDRERRGPVGHGDGRRRGALARFGEELAARRLRQTGMAVLERNWRCRAGEIDIVAREAGAAGALVVCEVKTRRSGGFQHPMAAVGPRKAERLRLLAQWWLCERWLAAHDAPPPGGVRIDLIGVLVPDRGAPVVEHAKGVA